MIRHLLAALLALSLDAGAVQAQAPGRVPVSADDLVPGDVVLLAARIGRTRLLDNAVLGGA